MKQSATLIAHLNLLQGRESVGGSKKHAMKHREQILYEMAAEMRMQKHDGKETGKNFQINYSFKELA